MFSPFTRHGHHLAFTLALAVVFNLFPLRAQAAPPSGARRASELPADNRRQSVQEGDSLVLREFTEWVEQFKLGGTTAASEQRGQELARLRREVMARLIKRDPRRAVESAVPARIREKMPESIQREVEEEKSGYGDYLVTVSDENDPQTEEFVRARTERKVLLDGKTYEARVYGRKLWMTTKLNIPLRGVVIDGVMALAESPVRVLGTEERDLSAGAPGIEAEVGGRILRFENREQLESFEKELKRREVTPGPGNAKTVGAATSEGDGATTLSAWTEGAKTVLVMRVDFSDVPGEPKDVNGNVFNTTRGQSFLSELNSFYKTNSYNKTSITGTVTPVLRMPRTAAWYGTNTAFDLLTDARAAAKAAGFDTDNFSLDVVIFTRIPSYSWAGMAVLGWKGTWLNGYFNLRESSHELGHNYGLYHANLWQTTDGTVIGAGTSVEYANPFDAMGGGQTTPAHHFSAWFKNLLQWLPDTGVQDVTSGGTYRLQAYDSITATGRRALKIQKDATTYYWVEFRQAITSVPAVSNGAVVYWGTTHGGQSHLLDMAPATNGDTSDSPLAVGQTFTDAKNGITIKAVAKTATLPAALDVTVTFTTNLNALTAPAALASGSTVTGTVKLSAPAPEAGAAVALSDDLPATTLPASVTIPAGATSKTFSITTSAVTSSQSGTLKASYRGVALTAPLTVQPLALSSLALNKSSVGGGGTVTGTVTLTGPAPAAGAVVSLSDNLAATTVPPSVTVPAGVKTKTFTITTASVAANQSGTVTASYGGTVKTAPLTVGPLALFSVSVSPSSAAGGNNINGTVTLNGPAPAGGTLVTLSDNLAATTVPPSVTIPAGAVSKTFVITSVVVGAAQTGTVTAKLGAVTKTAALTVRPAVLSSLKLNPTSVAGGNSVAGTVTLDGAAPSGGAAVALADNLTATSVPASVMIPAGAKTANFTITTSATAAKQTGTVTASRAGVTKSAALTVRPVSVQSITVSPNPIIGGSSATGTVTLERLSPANTVVTLSDNLPATTIPASVTVPANTLSKTFSITTSPVLASQTGVLTATANGEKRTLTLTVINNVQGQLLLNPGFELGRVNWASNNLGKVITNNVTPTHGGSWLAWLGSFDGLAATEYLYQDVTIPADAVSAGLNFYIFPVSEETTTTLANDTLKVQIRNSAGAVLATPATYSNLDLAFDYVKQTVDLSAYKGQTIRVYFLGTSNSSLFTWFFIDDVTLDVLR